MVLAADLLSVLALGSAESAVPCGTIPQQVAAVRGRAPASLGKKSALAQLADCVARTPANQVGDTDLLQISSLLNDRDPQTATTAATVLGRLGPAARSVLPQLRAAFVANADMACWGNGWCMRTGVHLDDVLCISIERIDGEAWKTIAGIDGIIWKRNCHIEFSSSPSPVGE